MKIKYKQVIKLENGSELSLEEEAEVYKPESIKMFKYEKFIEAWSELHKTLQTKGLIKQE